MIVFVFFVIWIILLIFLKDLIYGYFNNLFLYCLGLNCEIFVLVINFVVLFIEFEVMIILIFFIIFYLFFI